MRKPLVLISGFVVALNAFALPEYDPFEDAVGNNLVGQVDTSGRTWNALGTVNASGAQPVIVAGSLSYSGLPSSTSNSAYLASNGNAGQAARLSIGTSVSVGPLFYSFMMRVDSLGTMGTAAANNFFAGFSDTSVTQSATLSRCAARLVTLKNGTGYQIGIGKGSVVGDFR